MHNYTIKHPCTTNLHGPSRMRRPIHIGREAGGQRDHHRGEHHEQLAVALLLALVGDLLPLDHTKMRHW